jgi:hypothetical protein
MEPVEARVLDKGSREGCDFQRTAPIFSEICRCKIARQTLCDGGVFATASQALRKNIIIATPAAERQLFSS